MLALGTGWWSQRGRLDQYTAEVLLQHSQESEMVTFGLGAQTGADFGSRLEILRSAAVLGRVVDSLGLQLRISEFPNYRTKVFTRLSVEPDAPLGQYRLWDNGSGIVLSTALDDAVLATVGPDGSVEGPGFSFAIDPGELPDDDEGFWFSIGYRIDAIERLKGRTEREVGPRINGIPG